MKPACFVCLSLFIVASLFGQSNPVPGPRRPLSSPTFSRLPQWPLLAPSGLIAAPAHSKNDSQSSGPDFAAAVLYGSGGNNTRSVAVADVNGDGKPDLLVANWCQYEGNCPNGTIDVLLGNGDGTFQSAVSYGSGGWRAISIAVADVNGDSKPDIVVVNCGASDSSDCGEGVIGVLLGNGDGTFEAAMTFGSGGFDLESVAVADVNGDGKSDLVVVNQCSIVINCSHGSVGVLLGNGDGTFKTAVPYDTSTLWAYSVTIADVNRDGKPDLLVTSFLWQRSAELSKWHCGSSGGKW